MLKETGKINVLNYNENRVSVEVAPNKAYTFNPSVDGKTPTVVPMTIDEIRYANNSAAFKNGILFFDKRYEEEIYEELNIVNWKDILTNKDISEILLHPSFDGLKKIINIKNSSEFERVRAAFYKLKKEDYDVSVRVSQIIKTRYQELLNGQINTSITLTKKDIPENFNSAEVDSLKAQNIAMQEQITKMQELINQMMNNQSKSENTESKMPNKEIKKHVGRPKKAD